MESTVEVVSDDELMADQPFSTVFQPVTDAFQPLNLAIQPISAAFNTPVASTVNAVSF